MPLSDTKLRAIHAKPYAGKLELTDADGLSARVTPAGTISFQFRYRWKGKPVRLTLGRYPAMSLKDARITVASMRELYTQGVNPKNLFSTDSEHATLQYCLDQWWDKYASGLSTNTQILYKSVVYNTMYRQFEDSSVQNISVTQWVKFFDKQEKENKKKARVLLVQLRSVINWCISRQIIPSCELLKLSVKNIGKRPDMGSRVLTYGELAKIWLALENSTTNSPNRTLHQLLLLWGSRLSEMQLARIEDFNLSEMIWTTSPEISKMGNSIKRPIFKHVQPYIERLVSAGNTVIFPGMHLDRSIDRSSCNLYMAKLRKKLLIPEWRTHDFRRSLVTNLSSEGVPIHVTEKMLGHELGGVMAVYNKHDWIEEQRESYELYADKIFWHVNKLK